MGGLPGQMLGRGLISQQCKNQHVAKSYAEPKTLTAFVNMAINLQVS